MRHCVPRVRPVATVGASPSPMLDASSSGADAAGVPMAIDQATTPPAPPAGAVPAVAPAAAAPPAASRRRWRRGDLRLPRFPDPEALDQSTALESIEELRRWAEHQAESAIDWYLRDKATKRWCSRLLRAAAIV